MKLLRSLVSLALVAIVATSVFAFMATNTVADSYAGEGQGAVKGFTVTDITYDISPTDPSMVTGVAFKLSPADAKTVMVKFEPPEGGFVSGMCSRIDHTSMWTCPGAFWQPFQWISLQDLRELEVMAAQ
jgi:hypothetical protein